MRTATAAATMAGIAMHRCSRRDRYVEHALDKPRRPMKAGGTNPHHGNGADVVCHPGLGVKVMHAWNDQQIGRLARPSTHSLEQCTLLEITVSDQQNVGARVLDRRVEFAQGTQARHFFLGKVIVTVIDEPLNREAIFAMLGQNLGQFSRQRPAPMSTVLCLVIPVRRPSAINCVVMTRPPSTKTMARQAVSRNVNTASSGASARSQGRRPPRPSIVAPKSWATHPKRSSADARDTGRHRTAVDP